MHKHNGTHDNHMMWMMLLCAIPLIGTLLAGRGGTSTIILIVALAIFLTISHFWTMIKK